MKSGGPGASKFTVIHGGQAIGTLTKFVMGAGQFGSSWSAATKSGKRSTGFTTRERGAAWLVKQASA